MRLRDRFFLWLHDYCPRHLIEKTVGIRYSHCEQCMAEERNEFLRRLEKLKEAA